MTQEAAVAASAASALVRVSGPDRGGAVAENAPFFAAAETGGRASKGSRLLSLSVSGVVLRGGLKPLVLAPASAHDAFTGKCDCEVLLGCEKGRQPPRWRRARVAARLDLLDAAGPLSAALAPLLAHGWSLDGSYTPHCWLVLLECEGEGVSLDSPWLSSASLAPGDALALSGAPFGALSPTSFLGAVGGARLSHLLPPSARPAALLLDAAPLLPGMEGGCVAASLGGQPALVGMLLPPLRRCQHKQPSRPPPPTRLVDSVPLAVTSDCLFAALAAHLAALPPLLPPPPRPAADAHGPSPPSFSAALALAPRAVALLSPQGVGGGAWGSAVCISGASSYFLTAAHVVHPSSPSAAPPKPSPPTLIQKPTASSATATAPPRSSSPPSFPPLPPGAAPSALLLSSDGAAHAAAVLWVCRGPLDLALLHCPSASPHRWAQARPVADPDDPRLSPGAEVLCAAHGRFGPSAHLLSPSLAFGVVAAHSPESQLLRVSLPVHGGASGGALLSPDGALLGIVTSNASLRVGGGGGGPSETDGTGDQRKEKGDERTMLPTLNFSVAGPGLRRLCGAARAAGGVGGASGGLGELVAACLELDGEDERMRRAWALQEEPAEAPRRRLWSRL